MVWIYDRQSSLFAGGDGGREDGPSVIGSQYWVHSGAVHQCREKRNKTFHLGNVTLLFHEVPVA